MDYTFKDLKHTTLVELKKIAEGIEHEAVKGYTQMNKDHLLKAICTALNIEMHEHHEVVGIDKTSIKTKIKELKKKRDQIIKEHDHNKLKAVRKDIKKLKNQLRKATV